MNIGVIAWVAICKLGRMRAMNPPAWLTVACEPSPVPVPGDTMPRMIKARAGPMRAKET